MIVVSLSGGKDSVGMLLYLVERYGAENLVAHYQVLPEDWPETLPYTREVCDHLGVHLLAQQVLYEPVGDGTRVRRLAIRDIHTEADIVPWGTGVIAGITDLALRRGWPPSPGCRFCTSYFKRDLLNAWITQNRSRLSADGEVVVALGERAAESPRRARKTEWAPRIQRKSWKAWNWLPVHPWSRREVFRKLRDWGIRPHPAYRAQGMSPHQMYDLDEEGGPRTSCRFCIYATSADICHQAQREANYALLHRLVEVEEQTGKTWWANRSASKLLEEDPCELRTMFLAWPSTGSETACVSIC